MNDYNLSIIWWNTSLSPPISSKRGISSDEKKASIALIIKKFMEMDYEFICLGEVSPIDLDYFDKNIFPEQLGYFCAKGVDKENRLYFDTCIYYKKEHELLRKYNTDVENFLMASSSRNFKYGQKYKFILSIKEEIVFYLSHWPSQLNNVVRQTASIAERLRIAIEDELSTVENIVLIGDYNVEPYDDAIVNHLQCSREKDIVLKKPNLFYNPCWKFLTTSQYSTSSGEGTYYYPSGAFNRWHVIDQIMFSKTFLTDKWGFDDNLVQIIDINYLILGHNLLYNESDHYPLSTIIPKGLI